MRPYFEDDFVAIHHGDAWALAPMLEPQSVHTIVTSPPYWGLRDYGEPGQFGLESTPEEYVSLLVNLFALLRPALRDDGTVWLNLGDSFAGSGGVTNGPRRKDLVGIPWRVAFALQADGWYLRSDIIWHKSNPMPESVTDRPTKAHEYIFLLSKQPHYYYDAEAIKEPAISGDPRKPYSPGQVDRRGNGHDRGGGTMRASVAQDSAVKDWRNKRDVWTVPTRPFSQAHFAVFPPDVIKPCILAGCPEGGTVLDPFLGSGTTAAVARSLGRKAIGFELNASYIDMAAQHRLAQGVLL